MQTTGDQEALKYILDDPDREIQRQIRIHALGCQVKRVGKKRRKDPVKSPSQLQRESYTNQMRLLKLKLRSKLKLLKLQLVCEEKHFEKLGSEA